MIHVPPHILVQTLSQAAVLKLALAKHFGLNSLQFLTLTMVGSSNEISIKDLKTKLSVPGSSLTFAIDGLEKKGLVKRRRSKNDRRQWFLSLSAKGERLYEEAVKKENKAISPALEKLSEDERATFLKLAGAIFNPVQNDSTAS